VYGIAREVYGRDVARLALLLHITLLPILMLSSVLTNQHIAVAWLYVGIYIWLKAGRASWSGPILAGVFIAIGTIMRPIGIIVIAAILVNEVLGWIQGKTKPKWVEILRRLVTPVAAYQVILLLAGLLVSQTGISPEGLANKDPLWKLVAGLNSASYGSYSTQDEVRLSYGYLEEEPRSQLEKEIITERLTAPVNMVKLPFLKIGKLWAEYQPTWFTFPGKQGTTFRYLGWPVSFDEVLAKYGGFERAVLYMLSLLAFWGGLRTMRRQFDHEKKRFLILILGAYTCAHLIVEVQSRYLYFLFFIVVIFASAELLRWSERITNWRTGGTPR
jgi:hypothetical protein